MKSLMVNQHNFALEPGVKLQRSKFDRSHGFKTTFDADYLIPIFLDEVVPGDTHILRTNTFARLATPIFPFMDNMFADIQYFFIPSRLLWSNFEKMHGAQDNPGDSTAYTIPKLDFSAMGGVAFGSGSLADYFGLPVSVTFNTQYNISALPFRAYDLVWNTWYRDQNLQNSLTISTGDGPDSPTGYVVQKRGKRQDYFTSCLPFPQKGTAPQIPVHGHADVYRVSSAANAWKAYGAGTNTTINSQTAFGTSAAGVVTGVPSGTTANFDPLGSLQVDSDASGLAGHGYLYSLVNDIRTGFQVQKLLERDARGGTRYVEMLKAHYNVISPDFRLQRPEYLGGGSTRINVNPVPQTSSTDVTSPQGNLAGYGTFAHNGIGFVKSFVEHGYILGLLSTRADLTYQNGLDRMWTKQTRYEFYYPELANLGEQSVNSMELDCNGTPGTDYLIFGYQERYAEYRYKPSRITGLFRSAAAGTLDQWHLAEDFGGTPPTLGPTFILSNTPVDRVIAVPSQPHFLLDVYFQLQSIRPMPVYSVPGYVDHF